MPVRTAWPLTLAFLCIIPFVVALVVSLVTSYLVSRRSAPRASADTDAFGILKERYARGEITRDQYEVMRRDLD
ncbi:MAG TPA: SHOCT domain-containing protein [Anaerolineae bacterium]|nr:SHOCT domain-containing protein [Anaerolineae bacterium]HOQ97890.1 SHOCT domain-containing protein [Anaerolineae bacterium]HPL26708.1 SHOCT domain-containing protein [Anaerolineae bacterium]